jgi:hypothetical protein
MNRLLPVKRLQGIFTSLELLYWHLPENTSHDYFQKVRGFVGELVVNEG